jgi:PAS domain-containing protein
MVCVPILKRNGIVIACMAVVFVVISILTVDLHRTSEKEVVSQFQEHQLSHARYLTGQIKSYLESRLSGLQALSSSPSLQYGDPVQRWTDIHTYFDQLKGVHAKAISVLDERGTIIDSTDPKSRGLNLAQQDFFHWAKKKENQGKVHVSPFSSDSPPRSFKVLLVTPIYQDPSDGKHSKTIRKFVGALLLMIDFEEFLSRQTESFDSERGLHQVWVMDEDGTLLYQSHHKEMVLRNIYQRDKGCNTCHTSFDYVEKILKERQGKVDYRTKNSANKLAAFAWLGLENVPWIVVVNSPYHEVMAFERKSLRGHLMLLVIIVTALIAGFVLLNRNDQLRIKAQEEARHWRAKQALEERIKESEVRYRTIVETAHDIIWTLDTQGNYTSIKEF